MGLNADLTPKINYLDEENIKISKQGVKMVSRKIQTDTEQFFAYIFAYLNELEKRISSGEISVDEILKRGREVSAENDDQENPDSPMTQWNYGLAQ